MAGCSWPRVPPRFSHAVQKRECGQEGLMLARVFSVHLDDHIHTGHSYQPNLHPLSPLQPPIFHKHIRTLPILVSLKKGHPETHQAGRPGIDRRCARAEPAAGLGFRHGRKAKCDSSLVPICKLAVSSQDAQNLQKDFLHALRHHPAHLSSSLGSYPYWAACTPEL